MSSSAAASESNPSNNADNLTSTSSQRSSNIQLVIQRYRCCRLLINEERWETVGEEQNEETRTRTNGDDVTNTSNSEEASNNRHGLRRHCGLLVYVSFAATATTAHVEQAAVTLLNLPVLTTGHWGDGSGTMSLLELATLVAEEEKEKGVANKSAAATTSIVLVPQANLFAKVKRQGKSIQYHGQCSKDRGLELYQHLVATVTSSLHERQQEQQKGNTKTTTAAVAATNTTPDPSISPRDLFPTNPEYGSWDAETGLPLTYKASGEPLTKSAVKKCQKILAAHTKRHEKWSAQQQQTQTSDDSNNNNNEQQQRNPLQDEQVKERVETAKKEPVAPVRHCSDTNDATTSAKQQLSDKNNNNKDRCLDASFCRVVAGTFGKRQGLQLDSDMGPFCHILQL